MSWASELDAILRSCIRAPTYYSLIILNCLAGTMTKKMYTLLEDRGLLKLIGTDAREFLQGLMSNDVEIVTGEHSIYAALLTPQGKFLFDFFVSQGAAPDILLLDCEAHRLADLQKRLTMYKLRADVTIEDVTAAHSVLACYGDGVAAALGLPDQPGAATDFNESKAFVDPRLAAMGARLITAKNVANDALEAAGLTPADRSAYDAHRLALGISDGSRDILVEKSFPAECNFDELNAVSYTKGCYVGQELTARTHYRGTVRKRLLPVDVTGPMPQSGAPVMSGDRQVGEMRWGDNGKALAVLRLENIQGVDAPQFSAGEAIITPIVPDWIVLPELSESEG